MKQDAYNLSRSLKALEDELELGFPRRKKPRTDPRRQALFQQQSQPRGSFPPKRPPDEEQQQPGIGQPGPGQSEDMLQPGKQPEFDNGMARRRIDGLKTRIARGMDPGERKRLLQSLPSLLQGLQQSGADAGLVGDVTDLMDQLGKPGTSQRGVGEGGEREPISYEEKWPHITVAGGLVDNDTDKPGGDEDGERDEEDGEADDDPGTVEEADDTDAGEPKPDLDRRPGSREVQRDPRDDRLPPLRSRQGRRRAARPYS